MTTRNFDALFAPGVIALIGASNEPGSVGAALARNLFEAGFGGRIMTVNPHEDEIRGVRNCRSVADLPTSPDLAVIATPAQTVPQIVAALATRGCRAAVVISAGFDDGFRQAMLEAARPNLLRILGPNSLGFLSPVSGVNASFAHLTPKAGDIAFVSQSGAILTSILDWAADREVGFSHILSVGDMSDVDFGDALDYLALDPHTKSILLYVESITHARKFMSAARIAARLKPVIAIKAGRKASGAHAAASHTGALAGSDAVYEAAFGRAGMLRVRELRELFDAAAMLASGLRISGERLTILTNGGGLGVLAADALEESGGTLAALSTDTLAALDAILPRAWSRANPVDIVGDADGARYRDSLSALVRGRDQDAVLVMNCPTAVSDSMEAARAMLTAHGFPDAPPFIACWMGDATAHAPRKLLAEAGVPTYETPDEAVRAFTRLVDYRKNQKALLETPRRVGKRHPLAAGAAQQIIEPVLESGRTLMTAPEAMALLSAYGIPTLETFTASTVDAAAGRAEAMAQPVALKILSPDITHKSDVGGVRLNLRNGDAVRRAGEEMLQRVAAIAPKARIEGFTVQPMFSRPKARELILGLSEDPTFGPVLLFGHGGTAVEVIADRAMALPPLNSALASALIDRTRISTLLAGYRDTPAADRDAIVGVILALSEMTADCAEIVELDINPLLADAAGVLALDARVSVRRAAGQAQARLAIRPYPSELEHWISPTEGESFYVRPVRPEDEPQLVEFLDRCAYEDIRLRFHGAMRRLTHEFAARLSQIDYDREMAFAAFERERDGPIIGVARLVFDPNFENAEYAIIVRTDRQGRGLGRRLVRDLIDYGRARGGNRLWGDVVSENARMLDLTRRMGARCELIPRGGVTRTWFDLGQSA